MAKATRDALMKAKKKGLDLRVESPSKMDGS